MVENELNNEYFEWMCRLVCNERYSKRLSYRKLLSHLHDIDFTYTIGLDANRADDGIDLRYRFGYEHRYGDVIIAKHLDIQPCSVLEMMVALSMRCEEHIMDDPSIGDRMGQWFWNMIASLGLKDMSNARFDKEHTNDILARFMNREYEQNGKGSLFTIHSCQRDLRTAEIWYQMCWYLDSIL